MSTTDTAPTHSRLSPSKAFQWTTCTASIPFVESIEDELPPDVSGPAAIEGTKAHAVAETMVINHFNRTSQPLPVFKDVSKQGYADMKTFGEQYRELCATTAGPLPDLHDWGVELRVPLFYLKKEKGTIDFWCWNKSGLHLCDYKYGYDPVSSLNNKQMAIYAKSLIDKINAEEWMTGRKVYGDTPVTMTIFQPRLNLGVATWSTTVAELEKFVYVEVELYAKDIIAGKKGVFAPGDKNCKYCRAAAKCPARGQWLLSDMDEVAQVPDKKLPAVKTISDQRILEIYQHVGDVRAWLNDVEKYVTSKVLAGRKIPGLKVVMSDGAHRRWSDEAQVGKVLLANGIPYDEIYTTDIASPAQVDKIIKGKKGEWIQKVYQLQFKPAGAPIVVPESDPRREYKKDFTAEFQDVDMPEEKASSDLW